MLFYNFNHKFADTRGRLIFVPTKSARAFGKRLHKRVLRRWQPPDYFYHFQDGGHLAAANVHLQSHFFVHLDLARFFDSVSRGRVNRSLRRIGLTKRAAWEAACESTVSKSVTKISFSLPFGFVQSPILASVALATSALGNALSAMHGSGMRLSVYMDDIILSGDDERSLMAARATLEDAAAVAGFKFNLLKSIGPSADIDVFNLRLTHRDLSISAARLVEFKAALKAASAATADGILSYVATVNVGQLAELATP